jgi:peptide/nickel transport system substrate-binding protein
MVVTCAKTSRRGFLYGSAVAAGSVVLAACSGSSNAPQGSGDGGTSTGAPSTAKGSETKPLPAPSELAEQVKDGKLPPLGDRLPEVPYVVPHKWLEKGKYGGSLRLMIPSTSDGDVRQMKQYMYGHSLLRFVNDSLDIVPGLVESWEANGDQSEWTLHFRKGLKWSDGKPWTTADIMFWWNDMVLNEEHTELPPDECKAANGKPATLKAVDDVTLVMTFDTPAPLTPDRLAGYVKRGNGSTWMEPKHYLQQFHPTYNKSAPKDWASVGGAFELKRNHAKNPDCPTMTGWRVTSFRDSQQVVWERNPYYWVVDRDGQQLPYIDKLTYTVVGEPQVGKLQAQQGKLDYVHGPFNSFTLADISGLRQMEKQSNLVLRLWDTGSGTGSMFFFNQDTRDPKLRALIREPKFRQALSLAFNRPDVRKSIYYTLGEPTTGTLGVKTIEYVVSDEGRSVYQSWRDSFVKYDPTAAKKLLDEIGVVDKNGDGKREFPDGSPLTIWMDYQSNAGPDHLAKNDALKRDWEAVGLTVKQNPIPVDGWDPRWQAGELVSHCSWEVSSARDHLTQAAWLVPVEPSRWAPLQGQWYNVRGTPAEKEEANLDPYKRTPPRAAPEPGGPVEQLWKLYDQAKVEVDATKRHQLVWDMIKIHMEHGPFFMGSVANAPGVILAHRELKNVPAKENLTQGGLVGPWQHPSPAVYDPEAYFWTNPEAHA